MATTSLNPGVGPTNADIATAVAAPSAATIAAAVAAPSSATIATAVAAAVPTIGAINTSVANNAPSSNAWVHLGTGNLQSVSTATVSFSAYRKLKIVFRILISPSVGQTLAVRFNGDNGSGGTYFSRNMVYQRTTVYFQSMGDYVGSSGIFPSNASNVGASYYAIGELEVENASGTTSWKPLSSKASYYDGTGTERYAEIFGAYTGTSAITSVTILDTGANNFNSNANNTAAFQVFGAN